MWSYFSYSSNVDQDLMDVISINSPEKDEIIADQQFEETAKPEPAHVFTSQKRRHSDIEDNYQPPRKRRYAGQACRALPPSLVFDRTNAYDMHVYDSDFKRERLLPSPVIPRQPESLWKRIKSFCSNMLDICTCC